MPSRRILVNGATGALGRATIAVLGGHAVLAGTRRLPSPIAGAVHISDDGRVDPALLQGIDAIINCAGCVHGTDATLEEANVIHLRNLLAAAQTARVRRFVHTSSFSLYGSAKRIGPETPIAPTTPYGRSRLQGEEVLAGAKGISTIIVRLPFLFDRERPALLGRLVTLFRLTPVFPIAPYPVLRSMLTYPDAAALLAEAMESDQTGAVNVADPQPFSMDLLAELMRGAGLRAPALLRLPSSAVRLAERVRPAAAARLFASNVLDADANWAVARRLSVGLQTEIRSFLELQRRKAA